MKSIRFNYSHRQQWQCQWKGEIKSVWFYVHDWLPLMMMVTK